jgi:FtsH-binding integral membrane protein
MTMTPQQVTRWKARSYALFGVGIASFFMAYQYATSAPREGVTPVWVPLLFAAFGLCCFIAGSIVTLKVSKQNVAPTTADLSGPQGKTARLLLLIGVIALLALSAVNYFAPTSEPLWLAASVILLAIVGGCFVSAGRIARKLPAKPAAK